MSQLHEAHSGSDKIRIPLIVPMIPPSLVKQRLLSTGQDAKTVKGEKLGYLTAVQYLEPGSKRICPDAGLCHSVCLDKSGRLGMRIAEQARQRRTELWLKYKELYWFKLRQELRLHTNRARGRGLKAAVRLNGTSDIWWEMYEEYREIAEWFDGEVWFYDYTKNLDRYLRWLETGWDALPYHLTLSWHEKLPPWQVLMSRVMAAGEQSSELDIVVSFVWKGECPTVFAGLPVVCGDDHDVTFLHEGPVAVALKAKGPARKAGRHDGRFVVTPNMWKEVGAR